MPDLTYNPENIASVILTILVLASIGLFVLAGFFKMRVLRKNGRLLYSWDPKKSKQSFEIQIPHSGKDLLLFVDDSYTGVVRNSPKRLVELCNTVTKKTYTVDLSYNDGFIDHVSVNTVYTRPTKSTVLGRVKDIEEGTYSVDLKTGFENVNEIKRIDFVLSL